MQLTETYLMVLNRTLLNVYPSFIDCETYRKEKQMTVAKRILYTSKQLIKDN